MRAAKWQEGWEGVLNRFFAAYGLPLRWNGAAKRFRGVSGHTVVRINPRSEEGWWSRAPEYLRKYEKQGEPRVIFIVASKSYGDNVEDAIIVTRMGTFGPMLKALVQSDKERWIDAPDHQR